MANLANSADNHLLPAEAYIQFTPDIRICRILNGLWQVSGAHGPIDPSIAVPEMQRYHDAGFTTWDLADHYGPAEDFVGAFRSNLVTLNKPATVAHSQAFTKWVPRPIRMKRGIVESAIDVSRRRMGVESLDLLQFHWWDYTHTGYLEALDHLSAMRDEGKIRHVALTNFDTLRLEQLTARGYQLVSNQVQYSIVDRRPEGRMVPFCVHHNIKLLTYGTLCGGLLTDRYLGRPEPRVIELTTASLRKYKQMIDVWGGWALFQELLRALRTVADKHGVSIAVIAARYILDKPAVAGVIVGARLGLTEHRDDSRQVFSTALDAEDIQTIHAVTARSRDLLRLIGDCGDEYRG